MAFSATVSNGSPATYLALHKQALPNDSGTLAAGREHRFSCLRVINAVTMDVFGYARR
jgi:hypothetical protein